MITMKSTAGLHLHSRQPLKAPANFGRIPILSEQSEEGLVCTCLAHETVPGYTAHATTLRIENIEGLVTHTCVQISLHSSVASFSTTGSTCMQGVN